jgi:hypothetical protein
MTLGLSGKGGGKTPDPELLRGIRGGKIGQFLLALRPSRTARELVPNKRDQIWCLLLGTRRETRVW